MRTLIRQGGQGPPPWYQWRCGWGSASLDERSASWEFFSCRLPNGRQYPNCGPFVRRPRLQGTNEKAFGISRPQASMQTVARLARPSSPPILSCESLSAAAGSGARVSSSCLSPPSDDRHDPPRDSLESLPNGACRPPFAPGP